ncbi:polysaccharide biosynthesis tyrosine autokinase [Halomonas ramblicola]|uniref:polysaccharide biosynthesis tyrosine autokinase n=1 Tax=Halomonas ramblicola TaxID=747349 RepID=UPI0025B37F6D|nr:polysaccharide biosynthesis tyrosine autokinase [Halomonas ramblicola]MDN3522057.1 polysaccharide biosynthesis tyrosine autokinase [Halomonas ramblicola]
MNKASIVTQTRDEEIDFRRLYGILVDRRWSIFFITMLFSLCGLGYVLLATPIYQGDALVQVEHRSTLSPLGDVGQFFGKMTQEAEALTSAEIQILKSRMVLGQVVDRLELDVSTSPRTLPVIGGFILRYGIPRPDFMQGKPYAFGDESMSVGVFQVAEHLRGTTFTLRSLGDGRYDLLFNKEPLGRGEVGNLLQVGDDITLRISDLEAAPGVEFHLIRLSRAEAIDSLERRLGVVEVGGGRGPSTGILNLTLTGTEPGEIRDTLDAVIETFLTQNVQRQSAEAEQSLEFLRQQSPELKNQLSAAEERLNSYRSEMNSVDLNSESQAAIDQYIEIERQLNDLNLAETELAERFTPNHPSYQTLLRKKQQLQNERAELDERVNELPAAQQEVVRLTRDVEVTQAIYVNVLNKMQEMEVAKAGTVGNVRIIDHALVKSNPIQPAKKAGLVFATILGVVVATGYVLLRGLLQRGVETPEQIEALGLPVYATVPLSEAQSSLTKRIRFKSERHSQEVTAGLLAEHKPDEVAVEAVRALRTSLHFAMLDNRSNRLVITGPSPGTGKSFIALNLAAVCAQAGQRVLIVDADMRKGHVHMAFGGHGAMGLSELLSNRQELDEVIRSTSVPSLDYISRGSVPPNPSELLMHERFGHYLKELSERYDLLLIDTPPVLAVTDAAVIAKQCGTTLMVVRFQQNPLREVRIAQRRLEISGVTVKGVILNAMERKAATSYGYGYYNYAYK